MIVLIVLIVLKSNCSKQKPNCKGIKMQTTYGQFSNELDGRVSGHVLHIKSIRKDGKFCVTHSFGSGKHINKIYSNDQLQDQIIKFNGVIKNTIKF